MSNVRFLSVLTDIWIRKSIAILLELIYENMRYYLLLLYIFSEAHLTFICGDVKMENNS